MLWFSKRWVLLIIALGIIGIAVALLLLLLVPGPKITRAQMLNHLRKAFKDVPIPPDAALIHQRYYGCEKCQFGGIMALYAADSSPQDVRSFYREYIQSSEWSYGGEWEGKSDDQVTQWGLSGSWPFRDDSPKEQQFTLIASTSGDTSASWYKPREATRQAIETGQSVYVIGIVYTHDEAVHKRECPPSVMNACGNDWWEVNEPANNN